MFNTRCESDLVVEKCIEIQTAWMENQDFQIMRYIPVHSEKQAECRNLRSITIRLCGKSASSNGDFTT